MKGVMKAKRVGLIGSIVGLAAAGIAAGVATERYLVRRHRNADDPLADEPFGELPFDEELTVRTDDGVDLHVEIVDGPGPALVFVHGYCLDMGTFHFQRREFAGSLRSVFYDQPGHGKSTRLAKGDYTLESLGAVLRDVIKQTVPSGPMVLIGHSMGGMSIMSLIEQAPDLFDSRIKGVVLISTSAGELEEVNFGLPEMVARFRRPLLPLVRTTGQITAGVIDRVRNASTDLAWLLTRRYGFGTSRPSPSLVSYVERMNSGTPTDTIARYLRTLYAHQRLLILGPLAALPVLIICGDRDWLTPLAHSEQIAGVLPDAKLVVVEEGGHVALLEKHEIVNAAIADFLQQL
jgi:pimeloyl-ACP methyl ester carboxylesterase